jgi:hypothetical protein
MTSPTNSHPTGTGYFPGKHPSLASDIDRFLEQLRAHLEKHGAQMGVVALVLAGGYGRGEGGVFIDERAAPRLYNDLEFYLFTKRGLTPALRHWIEETENAGRAAFGIEVEVYPMRASALMAAPSSMFFYDLVTGHVIVHGPRDFLTNRSMARFHDPEIIPLHEATRLLFNRGAGLLFAGARLAGIDPDFDKGFIQRNHAKAKLALGDAVLVANGLYRCSCRERERLITRQIANVPPAWAEIRKLHTAGVLFKFNPHHENLPREELERQQRELVASWAGVFLWIEGLRLKASFPNLAGYARRRGRVLPEFPLWKNPALRLRDWIKHHESLPRPLDYPRGVLQRALAAFLSGPAGNIDLAAGGRVLGARQDESYKTFQRWWSRYN